MEEIVERAKRGGALELRRVEHQAGDLRRSILEIADGTSPRFARAAKSLRRSHHERLRSRLDE